MLFLLCLLHQAAWQTQDVDQQKQSIATWYIATVTMPLWDKDCPPEMEELQEYRYVLTVPIPHVPSARASAVLLETDEEQEKDVKVTETLVKWANASETSTESEESSS